LLFSAVISEHFSKNCMIISVVAAKIWYLKMYGFYWATLYFICQSFGSYFKLGWVHNSWEWLEQHWSTSELKVWFSIRNMFAFVHVLFKICLQTENSYQKSLCLPFVVNMWMVHNAHYELHSEHK